MKHIIKFALMFLICTNCTSEEEEFNYTASIRNSSNGTINIKGYNNTLNQLEYDFNIESMENGGSVNYLSPSFGGYISGADSLVFTFPNSKGYICDLRQNGNNLCFSNKNLFGDESNFNNLENNNFEFIITQSDFDNANDLP